MSDWSSFLSAMTLTLVRVSGMVLFAPFFSATAIPIRVKAIFSGMVAFLVAPLVAQLPGARVNLGFSSLLGELAVGLVYGLALALLNEMMLFAGQIAGLQFSFSLVNLLDPASNIQTPLLGELFQLMGTLVVIAAGLDLDFRGLPFGDMLKLMWYVPVYGGSTTWCISYCKCGARAFFSQRLINGEPAPYNSPITLAGEMYEPRCREHFILPGWPENLPW